MSRVFCECSALIEIVETDDRYCEEDDAPGKTDALAASGRMSRSMDPYRDLPRAKPEERNAIRGIDAEKVFGICADFPDEFLDDVMAIRRAGRQACKLGTCDCHPPIDVD